MKAGSWKVRITPPVGSPLAGYSRRASFSTGIHDHLNARILLLDDGTIRGGIVSCDLIGVLAETTASIRDAAGKLGFPGSNIMVCAFHTHSGPVPDLGYGGMGIWMKEMSARISSALPRAASRLADASLSYGSCTMEGLTINRRRPRDGPVDPELLAVRWRSSDGRLTHLLNYSCHAVVLGPDNYLISADYPGYAMRRIETETGGTCLFTNGTCGDINPLTSSLKSRLEAGGDVYDRTGGTFAEARKLGLSLASAAQRALSEACDRRRADLRFATHELEIPVRPTVSEKEIASRMAELERSMPIMERDRASPDQLYRAGLELSFAKRAHAYLKDGCARSEIQGIRIGDLALIGLPGEVFVETGLKIKSRARSRGMKGIVVELANDYLGYMPTDQAFSEGGYEVGVARSLGFGPGLERSLLEGADAVMRDLC